MWSERSSEGVVSEKSSTELDSLKKELSPIVVKEADSGVKGFDPLNFQPVMSPSNYEAEFAAKGEDLIFHVWPWKFHESDRAGKIRPRFRKGFETHLNTAFGKVFFSKWEYSFDEDMGSYFVRAPGAGSSQFMRENAIEALENLHSAMTNEE
ncbi:MAG: hypothetical protein E6R04_02855 [Spirochaetes bacterium]|nr:MAG: hypothetical protein E6R04_02855 [Spirochaetota bacterium]